MATPLVKNKLSGSTDGRGIKVAATASAGDVIHTARAVSGAGQYDEVYVWCVNSSAGAVKLTMQYGGTTSPDNDIEVTVPAEGGLMIVLPGLVMRNSNVLRAFAGTTNVLILYGFVNEIG